MLNGWVVLTLFCSVALFAGFCTFVARAFFTGAPEKAAYRMVGLWACFFAAAVIGCPVVSDSLGDPWTAGFAGLLLCAALGLSPILFRWWEGRDMAAAIAYLQMCGRAAAADSDRTSSANDGLVDRGDDTVGEESVQALSSTAHAVIDSCLASSDPADDATALPGVRTPEPKLVCAMAARTYDLTRREEEVLLLLLEGKSFAAIAGELFVSENTVKTHVRHIYRKMGVNRKQDLARRVYG